MIYLIDADKLLFESILLSFVNLLECGFYK